MAGFEISQVKGNDRFIAGGAVVLFVVSFLSWVTVSTPKVTIGGTSVGGGHASGNMWDAYGLNKLAWFLAIAAGVLVVLRLMGALDNVQLPVGLNVLTLALSGLATLLLVVRFLTAFKSQSVFGVSVKSHPTYGWYLAILVSAAMTWFSFLNVKASDEQLPSSSQTPPAL